MGAREEPNVFRLGGISYLRLPARDPRRSAAFYAAVFGWRIDADRDDPSFEDGTGHVIGHFRADLAVSGDAGILPYVFVESVEDTLKKVVAEGGSVATPPYPEGNLWVAVFRDPAGNVIGIWQRALAEPGGSIGADGSEIIPDTGPGGRPLGLPAEA